MTKVLVGFLNSITDGGINKYLMNMLSETASDEIKFDFLTIIEDDAVKNYLASFGSDIFIIPRVIKPFLQYKAVKQIIETNNYDICYFNISEAFNFISIYAAHKAGVKKIYVHSHSSGNDTANPMKRFALKIIHGICKKFVYRFATDYYSCSELAGQWMYPEKVLKSENYKIIYNAVNVEKFKFDSNVREIYRKHLNIEDRFVIGHVSNFVYQKNIFYLIDIINELIKINNNVVFLSIGDGADFENAKKKVAEYGIEDKVLMLGKRNDVSSLMQAMDYFILPSRFEGLPIVGVEAQAAGLKTLFSDTITKEVMLSKHCEFMSIDLEAAEWAKKINTWKSGRINTDEFQNKKFDIDTQKEMFTKMFNS